MSTAMTPEEEARHKAKMAKRKAVQDAEVASKTITEKGLLIVNTGPGKGKSTAAFGLIMRALGYEWRVGVVQYVKGAWETGERKVLERFPDLVEWYSMGEGFTWETQDRARDVAAAERAWEKTKELMAKPRSDFSCSTNSISRCVTTSSARRGGGDARCAPAGSPHRRDGAQRQAGIDRSG